MGVKRMLKARYRTMRRHEHWYHRIGHPTQEDIIPLIDDTRKITEADRSS